MSLLFGYFRVLTQTALSECIFLQHSQHRSLEMTDKQPVGEQRRTLSTEANDFFQGEGCKEACEYSFSSEGGRVTDVAVLGYLRVKEPFRRCKNT